MMGGEQDLFDLLGEQIESFSGLFLGEWVAIVIAETIL